MTLRWRSRPGSPRSTSIGPAPSPGLFDPVRHLEDDARVNVAPLVVKLVIESLLVAALAGGMVGALLPRRRWRHVALGAVGGVVAVGLLQGWTWQQFRPSAFQAPRFEGALERTPAALEAVKRGSVRSAVSAIGWPTSPVSSTSW